MALSLVFRGRPVDKIRARMASFGAEFGVTIRVPAHLSNTRRALAMAEFARDQGLLEEFREAATRAYWQEEKDLEDSQDLAQIAENAGLEVPLALMASQSDPYLRRVAATREMGIERMVTGVPTLFFGEMPVVGCQRYETYQILADRAGLTRRT